MIEASTYDFSFVIIRLEYALMMFAAAFGKYAKRISLLISDFKATYRHFDFIIIIFLIL